MTRSAAIVLLSATLYGVSPILMKVALDAGMTPVQVLAVRTVIAVPVLWVVLALMGALALPPRDRILSLVLMGGLLIPLQAYGFVFGLHYLPVSSVAVLAALYPLHVAWIAWIALGERIRWPDVPVLALVIAGAALVAGQAPRLGRVEGLAALGVTTLSAAVYAVSARRVLRDVAPLAALNVLLATSGAIFALVGVLAGQWGVPAHRPALWATAASGFLAGVFAPLLLLHGFRRLPAAHVAVLSSFEPVVTVSLGVVLLGDRLSAIQALGGACIIGGIAILQVLRTARATYQASGERRSSTTR
jgi:drug/metabolite transporter (DMT)-like permease